MLRFVASYFTSNTKPNTTNEENLQENVFNFTPKNFDFYTTETEHSDEVEQPEDISSLRERKLKELTEKVLLRKIYRQVVMNRHAQDHLPLSEIQEKLEEDDLPLKVLQDKLKQKENSYIYTTIRENINFLLYSKPSKSKKSRQSLSTPIITETDNTSIVSTPRDDRDYDIWDDAIIGHLMNLVDTIGVDTIQDKNFWEDSGESSKENSGENSGDSSVSTVKEITPKVDNELIKKIVSEVIKEVMKEEEFKIKSSRLNSTKVTIEKEDKEAIVAGSSATTTVAVEKNTIKDTSTNIENNVTTNIENVIAENTEYHLEDTKKNIMYDIQEEGTNLESRKIAEEIINFGETINVAESLLRSDNLMNDNISFNSTRSAKRKPRRSIFSLNQPTSSSNNKNPDQTHSSLKRNVSNLSRKSSIHSKKSYDNISRRSSISSKFSFSTDVIIEDQNEDGSNNNKFSKRNHSRKSLRFLKNIWKNNHNLPLVNNEESFISSREIREKYYQQFDQIDDMVKSDQQQNMYPIGTAGSDPGYSNFYLSMPNGKWMVRTRTGSRKITGTQYVDKEFI